MIIRSLERSGSKNTFINEGADISMNEYELYHHGVKGMKWGVRKKSKSSGGLMGGIRKRVKARHEETQKMKKDMGEARYDAYKSEYGRGGVKRIYKRKTEKRMSYRKAEMRELGRQTAVKVLGSMAQTAVATLMTVATFKAAETRAKQAANASLLRLEKGGKHAYRFVADMGDGMQIVENLK